MMRVGIDLSPITPHRTGIGRYTASLVAGLTGLDEEIALQGFASGMSARDIGALTGLSGFRQLRVPTRLLYASWSLTGRPQVDSVLGGIDVFHATNYFLPPVKSARRVMTFHDLAFLRHPELSSPRVVGPFSARVPIFAEQADAIVTCSEATKRDVVELLRIDDAKITVVHDAADETFKPVPPPEAEEYVREAFGISGPYILYVGTLEARKNIIRLLDAFEKVMWSMPHTLVLVGGLGWKTQGILNHLRKPLFSQRIRRLGYVEDTGLNALYSAADAFLFPSLYEGFGLPVLEAMACGCPVVCSNTSSLPEVGGDAALYADPLDTEAIADALFKILEDETLRASLRERGPKQAARFSWETTARQTLEVYKTVL